MRTTKVGGLVPGLAIAEFFFLFAPGPKVVGVKFVSGSETLRTAGQGPRRQHVFDLLPSLREATHGCFGVASWAAIRRLGAHW